MNKKFAIVGMMALVLITVGAGCSKNSNNTKSSGSSATVEEYEQYTWVEQGLTFKYPKGIKLAQIPGFSTFLYFAPSSVSKEELNDALAGVGFPTVMMVFEGMTLDRVLERSFSDSERKSATEVKIGSHTFTKFDYYDSYAKSTDTYYLVPFKNNVLAYKDGREGMGNAEFTLSTLEF